jgi:hypothetical protein
MSPIICTHRKAPMRRGLSETTERFHAAERLVGHTFGDESLAVGLVPNCVYGRPLMFIRIDDHTLVDDLCAHYRRSGFHAESVGGGMIEVMQPEALDPTQERRAVLMHLRVWEVANPDVSVEAL